jgi:RHS repeat-associated protein
VLLSATGPAANVCPFGFQTKYYDAETGLYYINHRYYSPTLGRWMSRDPIAERGGYNFYSFCNGNPFGIDKLGLEDGTFVSNWKNDNPAITVVNRHRSWWSTEWSDVGSAYTVTPSGNTYHSADGVDYVRTEQGGWHQYQANIGVYNPQFAKDMAEANKGYAELTRTIVAIDAAAVAAPFAAGYGLLAESFLGASAYSATYEGTGTLTGDKVDLERYADNTLIGTAGGVVIGKGAQTAVRLWSKMSARTFQVGEMMPNGQLAGVGPGAALKNSPEFVDDDIAAIEEQLTKSLNSGRALQPRLNVQATLSPPQPIPGTKMVLLQKLNPAPGGKGSVDIQRAIKYAPFDWAKYRPIIVYEKNGVLFITEGLTRVKIAEWAGISSLPANMISPP